MDKKLEKILKANIKYIRTGKIKFMKLPALKDLVNATKKFTVKDGFK